jgi:hypothetical protein
MFNRSQSGYITCYHQPNQMINNYRFNIEFLDKISTKMMGSCDGKTCYIYRQKEETQQSKRAGSKTNNHVVPCAKYFLGAWCMICSKDSNVVMNAIDNLWCKNKKRETCSNAKKNSAGEKSCSRNRLITLRCLFLDSGAACSDTKKASAGEKKSCSCKQLITPCDVSSKKASAGEKKSCSHKQSITP